ncbi:MAG: hypothetical protein ABIH48_01820 [Candidatus Falkowbacteria bacterium]
MVNPKLIIHALLSSVGVVVYTTAISWLLMNGENLFGKMTNIMGPAMMLMLFIVSALITSLLVFGRPIYLYFDGQKKEGAQLLFWTVGWLVLITVVSFVVMALVK